MNRPAFVAQRRAETVQAQVVEDAPAEAAVLAVLRLATPGVEAPAQAGQAMLWVADEAWAAVPAPAVVHGHSDQFDIGAAEGTCALQGRRVDHHLHRLETGDGRRDPGVVL